MAEEPKKKPRGLWEVMQQEPPAEPEAVEPLPDPPAPGKGLWNLMGTSAPPLPEAAEVKAAETVAEISEPDREDTAAAPAWFRGKSPTEPRNVEPPPPPVQLKEEHDSPEPADDFGEEDDFVEEPFTPTWPSASPLVTNAAAPLPSRLPRIPVKTGRSRGAMGSVLTGLFALPLAALSLLPNVWARIPATSLGFGAMVLGLMSFNEIQRSRGQQTGAGLAVLGMVLGTVAMFLGPLVIAPWSLKHRTASGREATQSHLADIGTGLRDYHARFSRYPPGGDYRVDDSGTETAMHGWMTHLLPYVGSESVHQTVDFNRPWNADRNQAAMRQQIPAYLVGGVSECHTSSGHAVAHFSGVGGQVSVADGRLVNAGIFDRSSLVTRGDVRDGLSQTLIVGEIPGGYRPWGEPGNWRVIGGGLNNDPSGFGNADRTGALFLRADGSVRFFSNRVSADVLQRLSTRDGEDNHQLHERYRE